MKEIIAEILELFYAGQRIFTIKSVEYNRVERLVAKVAQIAKKDFKILANQPQPDAIAKELSNSFILLPAPVNTQDALLSKHLHNISIKLKENKSAFFYYVASPTASVAEPLRNLAPPIILPLPNKTELFALFRSVAGNSLNEQQLFQFATLAQGLTEQEAVIALRRALTKLKKGQEKEAISVFSDYKSKRLSQAASLEVISNPPSFEEIGGLHELKEWLKLRKRAFEPNAEKFGLPRPKGVLLLGVQGCGKSLTAKATANLLGFPLVRLDLGALFVANTPPDQRLRQALMRCESLAPVVLWIDEVEKGFAGSSGSNADATRLLGVFLSWLQEHTTPVFVVATANNVELLPPEFVRRGRFDELFFVDLPSDSERKEILEVHLRKRNRNPEEFDIDAVVKLTRNFSGAEIEQVVISALYRAFAQNRELTTDDLLREAELLVPLYRLQEEAIKRLREWAENRTRHASADRTLLRYFK